MWLVPDSHAEPKAEQNLTCSLPRTYKTNVIQFRCFNKHFYAAALVPSSVWHMGRELQQERLRVIQDLFERPVKLM